MTPNDLLYQALLLAKDNMTLIKRIASAKKEERASEVADEILEAIRLLLDDAQKEPEPKPEPESPPTPSEPKPEEKPEPQPEPSPEPDQDDRRDWPEEDEEKVQVKWEQPSDEESPFTSPQVIDHAPNSGELNDWEKAMAETASTRSMAVGSYRERTGLGIKETVEVCKKYLASIGKEW